MRAATPLAARAAPQDATTDDAPARPDDAAAVAALIGACEVHDVGEQLIEEADIVGDWQRPAFDLSRSGRRDRRRAARRLRRGLQGSLGRCGRRSGAPRPWHRHGPRTLVAGGHGPRWRHPRRPAGAGSSASERLLTALGYRPLWTSWVLELPAGAAIAPQPLPPGYAVRPASGDTDHRAAWTVNEDAFLEWSDRERATFEEWAATVVHRPGYEDWQLRLAVDPVGAVVGMAFVIVSTGLRLRRQAGRSSRPAGVGSGAGAARRRLRDRAGPRRRPVGAVDRLSHRRPGALREGRHGGHVGVATPGR